MSTKLAILLLGVAALLASPAFAVTRPCWQNSSPSPGTVAMCEFSSSWAASDESTNLFGDRAAGYEWSWDPDLDGAAGSAEAELRHCRTAQTLTAQCEVIATLTTAADSIPFTKTPGIFRLVVTTQASGVERPALFLKLAAQFAKTGGGGGGSQHIIKDEAASLAARSGLAFIGAGVTCTDDLPGDETECDIPGGSFTPDADPQVNHSNFDTDVASAIANHGGAASTLGGSLDANSNPIYLSGAEGGIEVGGNPVNVFSHDLPDVADADAEDMGPMLAITFIDNLIELLRWGDRDPNTPAVEAFMLMMNSEDTLSSPGGQAALLFPVSSPTTAFGLGDSLAGATCFAASGDSLAADEDCDGIADAAPSRFKNDEEVACVVIEDLAAADDDYEFFMTQAPITITKVGCHCSGTCSATAVLSLEDRSGNAMTHAAPTCSAGVTDSTFVNVTAGNVIVSGEGLRFDVDTGPTPETDIYTICAGYYVN